LLKVFREWELIAIDYLWKNPEARSLVVYKHVNKILEEKGKSISRASVINFLRRISKEGILNERFETCKGGYRGLYSPKMTESEFKTFIIETALESFHRDFPEETEKVATGFY